MCEVESEVALQVASQEGLASCKMPDRRCPAKAELDGEYCPVPLYR